MNELTKLYLDLKTAEDLVISINEKIKLFSKEFVGKWASAIPNIYGESSKSLYDKYFEYCIQEHITPLSQIGFGREMSNLGHKTKIITINGKSFRIYTK